MIFNQAIMAQNDWAEYGFLGKVKCVELLRTSTTDGTNYTFKQKLIFNSLGNVDTMFSHAVSKLVDTSIKIKIYQFKNNRKCGWKEYTSTYQLNTFATIEWHGDSSYTEKIFKSDSSCESESHYHLKPNFNSYMVEDFEVSDTGKLTLISTLLFNRPTFGPANSTKYINASTGQTEETTYTIVSKDAFKNPTKTIGKKGKTAIVATRTYTYY